MASVTYLHFSMEEEDILEHANGKCHSCTLCRPWGGGGTLHQEQHIGILQMIALHFSMQRGRYLEHTNGKCHVLHSSIQEEDSLEHTNGRFHLCTL